MPLRDALRQHYPATTMPGAFPSVGPLIALLACASVTRLARLPAIASYCAAFSLFFLGVTAGLPGLRLLAVLPVFDIASNFKFYFAEVSLALCLLAGFALAS